MNSCTQRITDLEDVNKRFEKCYDMIIDRLSHVEEYHKDEHKEIKAEVSVLGCNIQAINRRLGDLENKSKKLGTELKRDWRNCSHPEKHNGLYCNYPCNMCGHYKKKRKLMLNTSAACRKCGTGIFVTEHINYCFHCGEELK